MFTLKGRLAFIVATILVIVALLSACSGASVQQPAPSYWPTDDWQVSTPEEEGFDSAKLADALYAMREGNVNIHSLMIIRHGNVILDAYFYPYNGETVHELASVTKSVVTTLIGIAADHGELALHDRMVSFFPERTIANRTFYKNLITVRQLSAMASGLACIAEHDEQTLSEMSAAEDYVQFTLDLETSSFPGTHFAYCSPGMHLLSAILLEATGMTTAEYARLNLFEPLGIEEVMWDTDPQGNSDGWAGLNLHPRDVAKLGYLMLYGGQWEGKQIVSSQWVEEATRRQIKTGMGDDYGYGWWVPPPTDFVEFAAVGRGGQYIRVFPELELILVTTGNGFTLDDIGPLLVPAMVNMAEPLPPNPAGVERLSGALDYVLVPPAPHPVPSLPETARAISGKTFVFEPNALDLRTLRLDFDSSAEVRLQVTFTNQPGQTLPVGLDGVYRMAPVGNNGLDMGLRGQWLDAQTFLFEYDQIANIDAYTLEMRFEGRRLLIESRERTHEAVTTAEGWVQE